jgi:hypothetical protein
MTHTPATGSAEPRFATPQPRKATPRPLPLPEFVSRLREACEPSPRPELVEELLAAWRPSLDSLTPFVAFDPLRYARRRVFRNDAFELILMCWDRGQATPVHDHDGQSGWITVLEGRLAIQEYERLGGPADLREITSEKPTPPGLLPLKVGRRVTVAAGASVAEAAAPESIHRVGAEQGRALSLHLYSGPLDSFLVFDPELGSARRIRP